jgi:alpha-L-arabinofuranosidase
MGRPRADWLPALAVLALGVAAAAAADTREGEAMPSITVRAQALREEPISPLIYGEFIEFLNDMIPGMWADKLQDRSFAGLTPPAAFYRKPAAFDGPVWHAFRCATGGYGQGVAGDVSFALDRENPFVGEQSGRIVYGAWPGGMGGIVQTGISVKAGERLDFTGYLRGAKLNGPVRVMVGRDYGAYFDAYDSLTLEGVGVDWGKFAGSLTPTVTDPDASFVLALDAPGTLWVGRVSLMPESARDGWRADVVETVKAGKPGIIRFGGSSLIFYDWETGIGPREKRRPFVNHPWNNTEEHDVGLAEFLRFCQLVGAEPLVCTNSNSSSVESIAHEVEYCNGAATTEWGRRRAQDGYPEPFGVRYWQIGNEQAGEEYENRVVEYARAMTAVDPSLKLLVSYPSDRLINELGAQLYAVCPHHYGPDVAYWTQDLANLRQRIAASPTNPHLKAGVTEWNHTAGDWGDGRAWLLTQYNALFIGRMLNLYQRNSDLVVIANRSNQCNSSCSGGIQTSPSDLYATPGHRVQALYANECGDVPLRVEAGEGLDVMATWDTARQRVCVTVVNCEGAPRQRALRLDGFAGGAAGARVITIAAPSLSAVNSFAGKDRVAPVTREVSALELAGLTFAPYSVTAVEISAQRPGR